MKNRFAFRKIRSRGIILAYKKTIERYIKYIESDSKYVLWFQIDKCILKMNENVLCRMIYIPPENSTCS